MSETVFRGAPHPGTAIQILQSNAGFYIGFRSDDGSPYSRETHYMSAKTAEFVLRLINKGSKFAESYMR